MKYLNTLFILFSISSLIFSINCNNVIGNREVESITFKDSQHSAYLGDHAYIWFVRFADKHFINFYIHYNDNNKFTFYSSLSLTMRQAQEYFIKAKQIYCNENYRGS